MQMIEQSDNFHNLRARDGLGVHQDRFVAESVDDMHMLEQQLIEEIAGHAKALRKFNEAVDLIEKEVQDLRLEGLFHEASAVEYVLTLVRELK